jgi:hypothetical protein
MRTIVVGLTAFFFIVGGVLLGVASSEPNESPLPFVDSDGTIHFPVRVRDNDDWVQ